MPATALGAAEAEPADAEGEPTKGSSSILVLLLLLLFGEYLLQRPSLGVPAAVVFGPRAVVRSCWWQKMSRAPAGHNTKYFDVGVSHY